MPTSPQASATQVQAPPEPSAATESITTVALILEIIFMAAS